MRAFVISALVMAVGASTGLTAQSDAAYTAFLWTSSTNATYEPSGLQTEGGGIQISYGPHGEMLGVIWSGFYTNDFSGLFQDYGTNQFIYQDRSTHAVIENYVALTNGYLNYKEHSVTTNYSTFDRASRSGHAWSVSYRTTVTGDGKTSQTVSMNTNDWASDFQRYFAETRDLDGHLLSWSLYSWTNDAAHSRQIAFNQYGSDDETHPNYTATDTITFDASGNVVFETYETEALGGFAWSATTSTTYVLGPGNKIASSTALTISTFNGAVSSSNVISSVFEKGNLVAQDSKSFGTDGGLNFETLTHFSNDKFGNPSRSDYQEFGADGSLVERVITSSLYDQFGHPLSQETEYFDAAGSEFLRSTDANTFVPRGQATDRPFTVQHFLDQNRGKKTTSSPSGRFKPK
jgi:hypothetical protein